jgi:hypothetical protein
MTNDGSDCNYQPDENNFQIPPRILQQTEKSALKAYRLGNSVASRGLVLQKRNHLSVKKEDSLLITQYGLGIKYNADKSFQSLRLLKVKQYNSLEPYCLSVQAYRNAVQTYIEAMRLYLSITKEYISQKKSTQAPKCNLPSHTHAPNPVLVPNDYFFN